MDKKDREKSTKEVVKIIHMVFCDKYNEFLGRGSLLDTSMFELIKKDYYDILDKCKLLPKHLIPKRPSGSFRDRVSRTI